MQILNAELLKAVADSKFARIKFIANKCDPKGVMRFLLV